MEAGVARGRGGEVEGCEWQRCGGRGGEARAARGRGVEAEDERSRGRGGESCNHLSQFSSADELGVGGRLDCFI